MQKRHTAFLFLFLTGSLRAMWDIPKEPIPGNYPVHSSPVRHEYGSRWGAVGSEARMTDSVLCALRP